MRYTALIPLGTEILLLLSSAYNLKKKVEKKKHEEIFHIISDMILEKSEKNKLSDINVVIHSLTFTGFSFFRLGLLHYNVALI
jgi:hypothetical protein